MISRLKLIDPLLDLSLYFFETGWVIIVESATAVIGVRIQGRRFGVAQKKSFVPSDVLVVALTKSLLFVLLVSFRADEFLNLRTLELFVYIIVVPHEPDRIADIGLLIAKLGRDRLQLFYECVARIIARHRLGGYR